MHHISRPALLVTLAVLIAIQPLTATSFVMVEDGALADQADLIVEAEIAERWVSDASGKVMTHYRIGIEEVLKGESTASGLEVRVLGGIDRERGHFLKIWGMPSFNVGERALLFLKPNPDGSYHLLHMLLGAFHERRAGGERLYVRSLDGAHEVAGGGFAATATSSAGRHRHAERFTAWLRERADGLEREPDYFVETPAASEYTAAFTLLADDDFVLRWFSFDDGKKVVLKRHRGTWQAPAVPKRLARDAANAWNRLETLPGDELSDASSEPTILMKAGGKTGKTDDFGFCDGVNSINASDTNDQIEDDYSCLSGGVLAIGGVNCVYDDGIDWKGRSGLAIAEVEVVFNNNVQCFANFVDLGLEMVLAHELGHTLGFGHSCGDDESPACSRSDVLDRALMRATAHGDSRGATLAWDDVEAAAFLYSSDDTSPVPCSLREPGNKRFCKKCGPCGEGQGNCRRDSQCLEGLTCKKNVGGDFGFSPGTDVCTPG